MRRLRGRGVPLPGVSTPPVRSEPQERRADTDAVPVGPETPVPVEPTMLSKTHGSILEFKPPAAAEDPQEANRAFIAALRAGDPRAREVLVERYLPLVQRLVAGAMGVESDLVDVVQDVFVAVLEGVHKLKDPSALQSWIASLAVF